MRRASHAGLAAVQLFGLLGLLGLLGVVACAEPTRVLLVVDAQSVGRARAAGLSIHALGPDSEVDRVALEFDLVDAGRRLPVVLALTPRGGDASRRWAVEATLERGDRSAFATTRVVGGFTPNRTRFALLCVEDACIGTDCGDSACDPETRAGCEGCQAGSCGVIEVAVGDDPDLRCPEVLPPPELDCDNGVDEDADGLIDCIDEDCERRRCGSGGRACVIGQCTCPGDPTESVCDDGIDEDCDEDTDCADSDCDGVPCDDGDACTVGESCSSGACIAPTSACDDGIDCTVDRCDAAMGCSNVPDDGNCDDQNPCTADSCDPEVGCSYADVEGACDDQNPCTTNDRCNLGVCVGDGMSCDDGQGCTTDTCDPTTMECVHTPRAGACTDGNPCTLNDTCTDGRCVGTPNPCNDFEKCTMDRCDGATGDCVHTNFPDGATPDLAANRVCCRGVATHLGSQRNCGGCFQICNAGACLPARNGEASGFHCNCSPSDMDCPNSQTCVRPSDEDSYRCSCSTSNQCRATQCSRVNGRYNICVIP